jgi:hypothetical protein
MQHRYRPDARLCAGVLALAFLAACGGGKGGSSPAAPATSVPGSTPAPLTVDVPGLQSSDGKSPSSYAVTSNPSGQSFTVGGATYTTPATVTPTASNNALAITFTSGYTVPIVQVNDGPHTVFYNSASDSTGTVALSSLQSIRRTASLAPARAAFAAEVHRGVQRRPAGSSDVDPTRLAVRMSAAALAASGRSPADVERAVGSTGRETLSATADRLRVVTVPAGVDVATFTRKLQAQPEVAEVSAVHRRHTLSRAPTVVSDPDFNNIQQWYTYATGVNYAWSYTPGTGAKLAVIDTGIDDNNTDLTAQLAYQETAVTPLDPTTCNPATGATTVVTPNTAQDDDGHGTNVSGIAIAAANTAGFAGTAWGAQLLAFKIFPSQTTACNNNNANFGANTTDEAQAISDAVAKGADVISLSLGASTFDAVEFNAIESAIAAGVTVVAAAGNSEDASGPGTLDYPGAYPGVISVGASALKDQYSGQQQANDGTYATSTEYVTSYSQYGPSLGVVAPGGDASCTGSTCADEDLLHWISNYSTSTAFLAADKCTNAAPVTSCVELFNGTSQATPQVAATAALLVAEAGGHRKLTPAQISYVIDSTADNINDPHQGHGRLNAYRALASLIRDTAAYSGPVPQAAGATQLIAFAYAASNTNVPKIIDASFPAGVPVSATGTFRIADVPAATGVFGVAVWYDGNGDGVIDAGDQIGVAGVKCSSTAVCAIGTITLHAVATGFTLP